MFCFFGRKRTFMKTKILIMKSTNVEQKYAYQLGGGSDMGNESDGDGGQNDGDN